MGRSVLYTIGYQGLSQEDLFNRLVSNGVQVVIDVRAIPHSRKKGFSKKGLASRSVELGLRYEHLGSLGTPEDIRSEYKLNGDFGEFAALYLNKLSGEDNTLRDLSNQIEDAVCCLLCYEKAASECHRSLVATEIAKRVTVPLQVCHL